MDAGQGDLSRQGDESFGEIKGDPVLEREKDKYERVWRDERYRRYSPGEGLVHEAYGSLGMSEGDSLIEYGCGTGRGLKHFQDWGLKVIGVDIAKNCLESDLPFIEACLWDLPDISSKWAFCTDVMEHIPEEKVDDVLQQISERCDGAFFQIAMRPDSSGMLIIGEQLHLTVHDIFWWEARLKKFWPSVRMKDLTTRCLGICFGH